jgi:UDP-glucose pyrophosphorylase
MRITKAIIPVAGWGTRRLPITKVIEKSMLPIGNRPIVDYVVEDCVRAGIEDIYMVISDNEPSQVKMFYEDNVKLERYLRDCNKREKIEMVKNVPEGVRFHYVVQPNDGRYGTALPVAFAVDEFGLDEPVAVLMGDDFIWRAKDGSELANMIKFVENDDESLLLGVNINKEEVNRYGVLEVSEEGLLTNIVEKPSVDDAPSNLINVSKYIMTPKLLRMVCDYVRVNDFESENEFLITDPIFDYVNMGGSMRVMPATGEYLDGGTLDGWLKANQVVCA